MENQLFQSSVEAIGKAQVDIARLETEVKHLTATVEALRVSNNNLSAQLDEIRQLLSEARGGWRVLMFVGGAGATLGATVSWVMQHLSFK